MALWMIFAGLTILALVWAMYPVLRPAPAMDEEQAYESAVYRDQLQELERDAARGLISEKEKQSALNEVSRRLLNAQSNTEKAPVVVNGRSKTNMTVTLVSALVITAGAGLLYKKLGRPDLPDLPQQVRIANAGKTGDMPALILKVQRYLEKNPKDIRGWKVLGPALRRAQRFGEAAQAFAMVMRLEKPTPPVLVDYAETALLANDGTPTDQVRKALEAAISLDKNYAKARFYWALVLQQDGKKQQALKEWRILLAQNPKNLQLQMAVQRQIAALDKDSGSDSAKMPELDQSQRQAAANMTPQERQAMIASMVQRLADRLKENGKDLTGWQKLIRARVVLGDKQAASADLKTARENFKDDKQALARLEALSAKFGLGK